MSTRLNRHLPLARSSVLGLFFAAVFVAGCQQAQTPADNAAADSDAAAPIASAQAALTPSTGAPTSGITSIVVDSAELAFGGREFGDVGPYEWIDGELTAEVDPDDPHNAVIVNIDRAPRNANGRVEYTAEFRILKPVDMTRGNSTLWYDVMNRGHQRAFNLIQGFLPDYGDFPETAEDIGDGFHLNMGYTMVWTGWQASATGPDRIGAVLPIATNPDGSPITEWRSTEIRGNSGSAAIEGRLYPTVAASMPDAKLYRRDTPHAEPVLLPRDSWSFATCNDGGAPVPSAVDVCLDGGFSADALYFLYHEVQDPIVMGIGLAAVRDAASFFRYDTSTDNPLVSRYGGDGEARNVITTALAWGQSQPGRFLRDFIYQGFNRDPAGRKTFDGVVATTGGSRKTNTNYQFGESRPIRARRDGSLRQGRPVSVHLRNDARSRFRSHRRHPGTMRYHRHLSEDDALRQRQRAVGCTRISSHDRSTWPERRTDSGQRSDLPMGQHTAQPVGFHRVRDDRRVRG